MPEKKEFNFYLGADPEFNILLQDSRIHAELLFKKLFKNNRQYTEGIKVKNAGFLGWDGCSSTAEMRPNPSKSPEQIVKNIGNIIKTLTDKIKIFDLSTLSEQATVGGHIHLEIPEDDLQKATKIANQLYKKICPFYLPIMLGEDCINLKIRIANGYGKLSDIRNQKRLNPDGKEKIVCELRAPSAEWLTTPKIAEAFISYMGVVFNEIINNPKKFNKLTEGFEINSNKQALALQDLALTQFSLLTRSMIKETKTIVKKFSLYPAFKTEIDYIFNHKKVIKDKKKADFNIAIGWNLADQATNKRNIVSEKKTQEAIKKIDFDEISKLINVYGNKDINIEIFSNALKSRIIAFNWKLSNHFFLFGLKEGATDFLVSNTIAVQDQSLKLFTGREMIKDTIDFHNIVQLLKKMHSRFIQNIVETTQIRPDKNQNLIMVGIPYEIRKKRKIKEFIELIYNLEKGKIKQSTIKLAELPSPKEKEKDASEDKICIDETVKANINTSYLQTAQRIRGENQLISNPEILNCTHYWETRIIEDGDNALVCVHCGITHRNWNNHIDAINIEEPSEDEENDECPHESTYEDDEGYSRCEDCNERI